MIFDLKTARVYRGYTQKQLADLLNVSRSTIVRWERGQMRIKEENFLKCCEVLHIDKSNLNIKKFIL